MESKNILLILEACNDQVKELKHYFTFEDKQDRIEEIDLLLSDQSLWERDPILAQNYNKERSDLSKWVSDLYSLDQSIQDCLELNEMMVLEKDFDLLPDTLEQIDDIEKKLKAMTFKKMFSSEADEQNAFLEIQSGSGGTESQDWAEMLMRMYLRWMDKYEFTSEVLHVSPGEVAGIKNCSIYVKGPYAFGWLRTETGIHRLVRNSPFDSANRRHTSFASIFISPDLPNNIELDVEWKDIRVDTYRASGAGGQHVNRTDSAVRLTYLPTNTVVQCQSERSQHKNKEIAFRQLMAKLYELEEMKKRSEKEAIEATKLDIGWGNQIRSYVLDQSRVKDLRTQVEHTNPVAVLDGDISIFLEASLKKGL